MIQKQTQNYTSLIANTPVQVNLNDASFPQLKKYYDSHSGQTIDAVPLLNFAKIDTIEDMFDFITSALYNFVYKN